MVYKYNEWGDWWSYNVIQFWYLYDFSWYVLLQVTQTCHWGIPVTADSWYLCVCPRLWWAKSADDHFDAPRCCQAGMLLMFLQQPEGLSRGLCWERGTGRQCEAMRGKPREGRTRGTRLLLSNLNPTHSIKRGSEWMLHKVSVQKLMNRERWEVGQSQHSASQSFL